MESWGDRIAVRLVAAATDRTRQLTAAHETALREWSERRRTSHDDPPPEWPAALLGDSLALRLEDDAGTNFRRISGHSGGTGTEWLVEWVYTPAPAPAAKRITLTVTTADGAMSVQAFDLA